MKIIPELPEVETVRRTLKNFTIEKIKGIRVYYDKIVVGDTRIFVASPIKTMLLDQSIMSGIGNIYANEICFSMKIHPLTSGKCVSKKCAAELVAVLKEILEKAIYPLRLIPTISVFRVYTKLETFGLKKLTPIQYRN